MLSVILATSDPYSAKDEFIRAGWKLAFETPRDSGDRLAIVKFGTSEVLLGTDSEEYLPREARDYRGAGVEMYITVSSGSDIEKIYRKHADAGVTVSRLEQKPWGVRAFHAEICGYRFLIAGK